MITAIVNFKLPAEIDARKAHRPVQEFGAQVPRHEGPSAQVLPVRRPETGSAAASILWQSRADADAVYTSAMEGLHRRALRRAPPTSATSRRRSWSTMRATRFLADAA